jgi:hypothetical protein
MWDPDPQFVQAVGVFCEILHRCKPQSPIFENLITVLRLCLPWGVSSFASEWNKRTPPILFQQASPFSIGLDHFGRYICLIVSSKLPLEMGVPNSPFGNGQRYCRRQALHSLSARLFLLRSTSRYEAGQRA